MSLLIMYCHVINLTICKSVEVLHFNDKVWTKLVSENIGPEIITMEKVGDLKWEDILKTFMCAYQQELQDLGAASKSSVICPRVSN